MLPLGIDEILDRLKETVEAWAKGHQATVSIALDSFNVLEILAESPTGMRVILHWAGDKNPSDILQAAIARNEIEVILTYNLGLTLRPDLALIKGTTTRPSLLRALSDLRSLILSLAYPDEQTLVYCVYVGTEPFITPEGMPLAAYRMHFQLDSAVNTEPRRIPV
jgi:hypothetical protein